MEPSASRRRPGAPSWCSAAPGAPAAASCGNCWTGACSVRAVVRSAERLPEGVAGDAELTVIEADLLVAERR